MNLKIDRLGRIVLPKPLRQRHGLRPGTELEVTERPGEVLLRPAHQKPSMVKIGSWWVHQGVAEPGVDWSRVVEQVREDHDVRNMGLAR